MGDVFEPQPVSGGLRAGISEAAHEVRAIFSEGRPMSGLVLSLLIVGTSSLPALASVATTEFVDTSVSPGAGDPPVLISLANPGVGGAGGLGDGFLFAAMS